MATITGSEVLAQALRSQGMDTLFYLMGGPMLETEAACIKLGIRAIDTRHEQAAALAAHAWTRRDAAARRVHGLPRARARPTSLTGVANAFTDAAPLIAIGGSSPRVFLGMEAFQEIDQVAVFKPITKWAERIYDARRIPEMVADGVPPGDHAGGPARSTSTCPATSSARRSRRSSVTYPRPVEAGAAHPRRSRRDRARPSRCSRRPSGR